MGKIFITVLLLLSLYLTVIGNGKNNIEAELYDYIPKGSNVEKIISYKDEFYNAWIWAIYDYKEVKMLVYFNRTRNIFTSQIISTDDYNKLIKE